MANQLGRTHDQEIVSQYQSGATSTEIARIYGVSGVTILRVLRRNGIPARTGGKPRGWQDTEANRRELVAAYIAGESIKKLARRLRCRSSTIMMVLSESGLDWRHPGGRRRFTDEEAAGFAAAYRSGETLTQIGKRHGASAKVIREYLGRTGVTIRPMGVPAFWTEDRKAEAERRYRAGESQQDIAAALGCGTDTLMRTLRELGALVPKPSRRGEASPLWRGGRIVRDGGYIRVKVPEKDQHLADPTRAGYMMEHRLVMARSLGRPLLPGENVHHKNGVRADNALGNLELWVRCQPCGQRVEEIVEWATIMLQRYAPHRLADGSAA